MAAVSVAVPSIIAQLATTAKGLSSGTGSFLQHSTTLPGENDALYTKPDGAAEDNEAGQRLSRKAELEGLLAASQQFTDAMKKSGISQATLMVLVRCRPMSQADIEAGTTPLTRLIDDKVMVVMEPGDDGKARLQGAISRPAAPRFVGEAPRLQKERRYIFDRAFDTDSNTRAVYNQSVMGMIPGVLKGLNATVFAYGSTGSGKTHTIVGSSTDPGLMILSMNDIFAGIARERDYVFEVHCSYCEVYNEVIYDLLTEESLPLDLREDPELGPQVANLSQILANSSSMIFDLLQEGNSRRKTESTDANSASSRSHAVLSVVLTRRDAVGYEKETLQGKLTLVDLAGSERASETHNKGRQLKDSANINRSLLALANCINALGKRRRKGFVFVPFRNSKLTRLLKDALCGNSRTIMIATVSPSPAQYHHTVNTLKYADRAKELKTHVRRNTGTVQEHVTKLRQMISQLQKENATLKALQQPPEDPAATKRRASDSSLALRDGSVKAAVLKDAHRSLQALESQLLEINQGLVLNQSKIVECEDLLIRRQAELASLDAELAAGAEVSDDAVTVSQEQLRMRREAALSAERAANLELMHVQSFLVQAEVRRQRLLQHIAATPSGFNRDWLRGVVLEGQLRAQRANAAARARISDMLVMDQQAVITNLWHVLHLAGITPGQAYELAAKHGLPAGMSKVRHLRPSPSRRESHATSELATLNAPKLEQLLSGAFTEQRQKLWKIRRQRSRKLLEPASPHADKMQPAGDEGSNALKELMEGTPEQSEHIAGNQVQRPQSTIGSPKPLQEMTTSTDFAASFSFRPQLRSRYSDSGLGRTTLSPVLATLTRKLTEPMCKKLAVETHRRIRPTEEWSRSFPPVVSPPVATPIARSLSLVPRSPRKTHETSKAHSPRRASPCTVAACAQPVQARRTGIPIASSGLKRASNPGGPSPVRASANGAPAASPPRTPDSKSAAAARAERASHPGGGLNPNSSPVRAKAAPERAEWGRPSKPADPQAGISRDKAQANVQSRQPDSPARDSKQGNPSQVPAAPKEAPHIHVEGVAKPAGAPHANMAARELGKVGVEGRARRPSYRGQAEGNGRDSKPAAAPAASHAPRESEQGQPEPRSAAPLQVNSGPKEQGRLPPPPGFEPVAADAKAAPVAATAAAQKAGGSGGAVARGPPSRQLSLKRLLSFRARRDQLMQPPMK